MNLRNGILMVLALLACVSCKKGKEMTLSGLNIRDFQTEVDGQLTDLYVLKNKNGMEACITNYGAKVVSLMVPDRNGKMEDVVYGFSTVADYMKKKENLCPLVNDSSKFFVYKDQDLASKIWQAEQLDENALKMTLYLPDGENGLSGHLKVRIIFMLTNDNELDIHYEAFAEKPTAIYLSHPISFNLSADFNATVDNQLLYINANNVVLCDSMKKTLGDYIPVDGTSFDFIMPHLIGERIDANIVPSTGVEGDFYWVLNMEKSDKKPAASLVDHKSGRIMEFFTTEPGLQVFTTNRLQDNIVGKKGVTYQKRCAICIEASHLRDSIHEEKAAPRILRSGEKFYSRSLYRFGIDR